MRSSWRIVYRNESFDGSIEKKRKRRIFSSARVGEFPIGGSRPQKGVVIVGHDPLKGVVLVGREGVLTRSAGPNSK